MFRPSRRFIAPAALAVGLAFAMPSCSSTTPMGVQLDDSVITTKVKSKFAGDPEVAGMNVGVETVEGTVTLTGRVKSETERQEAEKLAKQTDGVRRVVNLLKVGNLESNASAGPTGTKSYSGQTNPNTH
jgi:hyperosmotically inducible protein